MVATTISSARTGRRQTNLCRLPNLFPSVYHKPLNFSHHTLACSKAYGEIPYVKGIVMPATTRFDLKMDAEEKDIVSRAAALMGTTMAAFVRMAAKEKARELLDRESRITMTAQDLDDFAIALNADQRQLFHNAVFMPNEAPQNAMKAAHGVKPA